MSEIEKQACAICRIRPSSRGPQGRGDPAVAVQGHGLLGFARNDAGVASSARLLSAKLQVAHMFTHRAYLRSTARTVSATFSGVKPKCLNSTGAGADSP